MTCNGMQHLAALTALQDLALYRCSDIVLGVGAMEPLVVLLALRRLEFCFYTLLLPPALLPLERLKLEWVHLGSSLSPDYCELLPPRMAAAYRNAKKKQFGD